MPVVSKFAYERSLTERVSMNWQILEKAYWTLPVDDIGHEEFTPVGRGEQSSPTCSQWRSFSVCYNIEGHDGKFLNNVDVTGKVVVKHNHWWCNRSSCPKCFIRGWSVRGARAIGGRLSTGVKRGLGKVEHVVVSVAIADRGLPESVFRKKCRDALRDRGVDGGGMVFHGFRISRERGCLVWSPHYHTLCYILGGFDRCRECVHKREDCSVCDGFKGREVRGYKKDGYLVKVLPERLTITGSAFYLLNHGTLRLGIKRFCVVTWFGSCASYKFKSEKAMVESTCPVCGEDMVKSMYKGSRFIVKDIGSCDYVPVFVDDEFNENGEPNYVPVR